MKPFAGQKSWSQTSFFWRVYKYRSHIVVDNWHMNALWYEKYIVLFSSSSISIIGTISLQRIIAPSILLIKWLLVMWKNKMIEVMLPNVKTIPKYLLKYFFLQQTDGGGLALLFWLCFCYRTPFNFFEWITKIIDIYDNVWQAAQWHVINPCHQWHLSALNHLSLLVLPALCEEAVHKWRHPHRGMGDLPKGDNTP